MAKTRTTIIIPNYNGARHLQALLPTIIAQTQAPARVLVVDNGSVDESLSTVQGTAEVLPLTTNYGFAYAVNRGIEAADTEFVAILNNDVLLHPEWLARLEESLDETQADFACPLLASGTVTGMADGAYDLLSRSGCALRALHGAPLATVKREVRRRIQFPPMTAALFRRGLFDKVGLLDESFESYLEDVEFGLRAAGHGSFGYWEPRAYATHVGSATLGVWSARATALIARNQLLLICRHYSPQLLRRWWWPVLVGNLLYLLLALRHGQGGAALRGKWRALRQWKRLRGKEETPSIRAIVEKSDAELYALTHPRRGTGPKTGSASATRMSADQESANTEEAVSEGPSSFWRLYYLLCPAVLKVTADQ